MPIKNTTIFITGMLIGALSIDLLLSETNPVVTAIPKTYTQPYSEYRNIIPLSERIRWCRKHYSCSSLARAVVYEARSESALGQAAVAHVIVNRTEDKKWPNTIPAVIKQHKQFSFYGNEHKQNKPRQEDWNNAYVISYDVLNKKLEDPTGNALYYHTKDVAPKWASGVEYAVTIDKHIFYR